jgi:hypothetical protein
LLKGFPQKQEQIAKSRKTERKKKRFQEEKYKRQTIGNPNTV